METINDKLKKLSIGCLLVTGIILSAEKASAADIDKNAISDIPTKHELVDEAFSANGCCNNGGCSCNGAC